jgi:hypothetical protein
MPVSELLIKALLATGAITPEKAQELMNSAQSLPGAAPAPTSAEIHAATSSVLPDAVNEATTMPENPSFGEKAVNFGTGMISNLFGGPKPSTFGQFATKAGTRVAAPTAIEAGVDPLLSKLSPGDAAAVKTLLQLGAGGGLGKMEKGLAQRSAANTVNSSPAAMRAFYDALIADGLDPAAARVRIAELGGGRAG